MSRPGRHALIPSRRLATVLLAGAALLAASGCAKPRTLEVTATAYNTVRGQTQGNPNVGAWGDVIKPGAKTIAVSRDLLGMGLTRGTKVRIEGLPGRYVVMDKMNRRWKKRIDIHMGKDISAARDWGKRKVKISWYPRSGDGS